jgi:hypothetical protein
MSIIKTNPKDMFSPFSLISNVYKGALVCPEKGPSRAHHNITKHILIKT